MQCMPDRMYFALSGVMRKTYIVPYAAWLLPVADAVINASKMNNHFGVSAVLAAAACILVVLLLLWYRSSQESQVVTSTSSKNNYKTFCRIHALLQVEYTASCLHGTSHECVHQALHPHAYGRLERTIPQACTYEMAASASCSTHLFVTRRNLQLSRTPSGGMVVESHVYTATYRCALRTCTNQLQWQHILWGSHLLACFEHASHTNTHATAVQTLRAHKNAHTLSNIWLLV